MRPLQLHLRNVGSHADLTVEFPDGCMSIVGSNGSGKSTILAALDVALFGAEGRSLGPMVRRGGDGSMSIELEFDHAGERFRVRRQVTRSKSALDLERLEEHMAFVAGNGDREDDEVPGIAWMALTRETARETQAELERILSFSRATLRASSLLMQGDASAFCDADPKLRKQILAEVLGLDRYQVLAETVRVDRATADQETQRLTGRLDAVGDPAELETRAGAITTESTELRSVMEEAAAQVEQAERAAEEAAERWQALSQQTARRRELEAELRTAQERARSLRKVDVDAQVAREKADGVRTEIVRLDSLVAEHTRLAGELRGLEEVARVIADRAAEVGRLEREKLTFLEAARRHANQTSEIAAKLKRIQTDPGATCDRCEQHLPDQARETALASLRAEHDAADAARADAERQAAFAGAAADAIEIPPPVQGLDELRRRVTELAGAGALLAAARATLAGYEDTVAKASSGEHVHARNEADIAVAELGGKFAGEPDPEPGAEAQALQEATAARVTAATLRDQGTQAQLRLRELGAQLEHLRERITDARDTRTELDAVTVRRNHLALLERAYGPNGIPLLILENAAVPAIEEHANEVLAQLAGKPAAEGWRVELRTQAETKTGTLRDALDIVVHVPDGTADYQTLSGSEKVKVAIALRLGVARLLAHRRGADCQLLALDEPEFLDDDSKAALVDLITGLRADYRTVVVISHDTELRDRFDHTLALETRDQEPVLA